MGNYLLCCTPARSHLDPMLTIAEHLHRHGHRVRMLTGQRFRNAVQTTGAEHVALPTACDYDDTDTDTAFPGRAGLGGLARLRFDLDHIFLDAIPHQYRALSRLIDQDRPDSILVDPGFYGATPLILGPPHARPPILVAGFIPLPFTSRDTAPFGLARPPMPGPLGRFRNRAMSAAGRRLLRDNERHGAEVLHRECGRAPNLPFVDWLSLADGYLQLSVPGFEYPRSDLPATVTFVGPVLPPSSATLGTPPWWDELTSADRPVVYVTQGTVDNADLGRLIGPTLRGLADLNVTVIATTGGRPASAIPGAIPANGRITDFASHADLLPHVDVMITNGGFGGVQQALANGIPLVVAGDSEDKPEVAARVAWARTGINLRTATPSPARVRKAVQRLLTTPTYRHHAQQLAKAIAATSALEAIERSMASCTPVDHSRSSSG
jgi:UDP:flavonoid glycosyltransferase YjiC (YdhE family)